MPVQSQPKLFYFTDHYKNYSMVLIRLSKADRWKGLWPELTVLAADAELWPAFLGPGSRFAWPGRRGFFIAPRPN
jgi:hypothetical protein